ncbi:hypothetical protein, partial [Staphylococcus aureus]|uniref:hypothetical protein n=1 Tax=Staphylococcus aureus TaxID=1280 RepID=UPI001B302C10
EKSAYNNVQVGDGPNIVKLDSQFLQTMQVGGPNTEAGGKSAYNNVQVGVGRRNKFCENIISVPPHSK